MIDKQNTNRRYNWTQCPRRDTRETRWSSLYVSLNPSGVIRLSRLTHESLGSPDSYVLAYDSDLEVVGLQPARLAVTENAYPALERGKLGGRIIYAHTMIRAFNLYLSETAVFPRCFIDNTGTLILELNDVKPAVRNKRRG